MSDLIERLRDYAIATDPGRAIHPSICDEAADEIERLTADLDYWKKLSHDEYWKQVKTLETEIERLAAELSEFTDLQLCDCCEGLFESVEDAGGHMQCVGCSEDAKQREYIQHLTAELLNYSDAIGMLEAEQEKLQAENERLRQIIDERIPDQGSQIKRLQAKVERLEAVVEHFRRVMIRSTRNPYVL